MRALAAASHEYDTPIVPPLCIFGFFNSHGLIAVALVERGGINLIASCRERWVSLREAGLCVRISS
jgi:hypothetical protein